MAQAVQQDSPPVPPRQPNLDAGDIVFGPGVWIPRDRLRFSFSRSSGPGGQAVNKLSTRVELRLAIQEVVGLSAEQAQRLRAAAGRRTTQDDELVIQAQTFRSQLDNKLASIEILRSLVAAALRKPKRRVKTKPSRAARERRLTAKRARSQTKQLRQSRRRSGSDDSP